MQSYMETYQSFLTRFKDDEQTYQELLSIKEDEKEIKDRFYTELSFGTAGMRGVIGAGTNRMNVYNVRRATQGLADFVKSQHTEQKGVVIAYDSRLYSDVFAKQTALVLCQNGIKAYLFDALRPVPILSYAIRHLNAAAGVVITASHNPKQYNGYKAYGEDGAQLSPEHAKIVTDFIYAYTLEACVPMDEQEALDKGLLQMIGNKQVDDDYIDMVKQLALCPDVIQEQGKNLNIVYTPLHGSGNVPVRRMLQELGVQNVSVVKEQELPDPAFPTVSAPNPEDKNAFALAIPLAQKVGATVCFATDPDCDRMGVSVKGQDGVFYTLTGNQIGCLLLSHILETLKKQGRLPQNGAVIKSIVSSELASKIAHSYGVEMMDVLTGFKFIGEKIQQFEEKGDHTFLFGFEESYGYLSGTKVRDKDGVNASLLLCEAACAAMEENVTLYDKLSDLYKQYGYYVEKVISVTLPGADGVEKMKNIMSSLRQDHLKEIAGIKVLAVRDYLKGERTENSVVTPLDTPPSDVLYYELEEGNWVCVRPSGTEPKIKLYVNTCHKEEQKAQEMQSALQKAMQALIV